MHIFTLDIVRNACIMGVKMNNKPREEMVMARILGINDEVTTCDCCGKVNLKRTVAIELEDGEIVRYGVDCASRVFKARVFGNKMVNPSASSIKNAALEANYYKRTGQQVEVMRLYR